MIERYRLSSGNGKLFIEETNAGAYVLENKNFDNRNIKGFAIGEKWYPPLPSKGTKLLIGQEKEE